MATQLKIPDPNISCIPGMCLIYVQQTFDISAKYPTATVAWKASQYKHTDQDFPADVWVPLWFSLADDPNGHVALRQPDGTIWSASHPTLTTPVHHASLAELQSYYSGRLTYQGWTEDVEDVLVVDVSMDSRRALFSAETQSASLVAAIPTIAPIVTATHDVSLLVRNESSAGLNGYTGHRPNHPSIEHKRLSRQIEEDKKDKKRNTIKPPARRKRL